MRFLLHVSFRRPVLLALVCAAAWLHVSPPPTPLRMFAVVDEDGAWERQFVRPGNAAETLELIERIEAARDYHGQQSQAFYASQWECEVADFYQRTDQQSARDLRQAQPKYAELPAPASELISTASYEISATVVGDVASTAAVSSSGGWPVGQASGSASGGETRPAVESSASEEAAAVERWQQYWEARHRRADGRLAGLRQIPADVAGLRRLRVGGTVPAPYSKTTIAWAGLFGCLVFWVTRWRLPAYRAGLVLHGAQELEVPAGYFSKPVWPTQWNGRVLGQLAIDAGLLGGLLALVVL